ncbi:YeiH family protein [Vulgatibacter sp.]|uniref:YeiH family protein n=1 Tax=Vulgatibacter sp. TaxID=1971226 RepID=UPI003562C375
MQTNDSTMQPAQPTKPRAWEEALFGMRTAELGKVVPGVLLALGIAIGASFLADALGAAVLRFQGLDPAGRGSPISAISVAVVLGLILANVVDLPKIFGAGLGFSVKKILRLGIILVGIKLSVIDVLQVGAIGIPIVVALVLFALAATLWIAKRAGLSNQLGSLAAASTAICGITATVAIAPSIEADDKEVAYTVANVTLFGLFGMLAYPYLAHFLFGDASSSAGLFLGTAIHDTSQVMGAALSYKEVFADERAMQVATVAKLTRNALLVAVVPFLAFLHARRAGHAGKKVPLAKLFPVFVLGFLALSLVRTLGDVGLQGGGLALGAWDAASWKSMAKFIGEKSATVALGTALAAVGLTTRLSVFKKLGLKPFFVGLSAALIVGVAALALAALAGPFVG